ncbi:hypothetical protein CoNPh35_CDS0021 [Staphylococcus phage S-CoN_Ph35]|nr:hypothetical protein CoNPh35_CDS0021 [Staphylococcus phage S-CoN_Ph35]
MRHIIFNTNGLCIRIYIYFSFADILMKLCDKTFATALYHQP